MTLLGKKVLAVIPARGGSKSIPRKNLKKIGGKSLIYHAASICNSLPWLDFAILSTDDQEMVDEGLKAGLKVPFIRPEELARDDSRSEDMWKHAWLEVEKECNTMFDVSILLQPTSPMRTKEDVEKCVRKLIEGNHSGVVTVSLTPADFRPHKTLMINSKGKLEFYLPNGSSYNLRQSIPSYYYRDGICYALKRKTLIEDGMIIDDSCHAIVTEREVINIDEPFDLELAEFLVSKS